LVKICFFFGKKNDFLGKNQIFPRKNWEKSDFMGKNPIFFSNPIIWKTFQFFGKNSIYEEKFDFSPKNLEKIRLFWEKI
jgi:hypothetical protein